MPPPLHSLPLSFFLSLKQSNCLQHSSVSLTPSDAASQSLFPIQQWIPHVVVVVDVFVVVKVKQTECMSSAWGSCGSYLCMTQCACDTVTDINLQAFIRQSDIYNSKDTRQRSWQGPLVKRAEFLLTLIYIFFCFFKYSDTLRRPWCPYGLTYGFKCAIRVQTAEGLQQWALDLYKRGFHSPDFLITVDRTKVL